MEHLRYSGKDEIDKFTNTWKSWIEFKKTRKYAKILGIYGEEVEGMQRGRGKRHIIKERG